jgi:hypothetical protein
MKKHIDKMLEDEVMQLSTAAFSVPGFIAYKADPNNPGQSKSRPVQDFRSMNQYIHILKNALPHIWSSLEDIGHWSKTLENLV